MLKLKLTPALPTASTWKKALLPLAFLFAACGQARYELPKTPATLGGPQQVSPQQTQQAPSPVDPRGPTAHVEVIANSQSVTTIPAGTVTEVQPTADTVSPSFVGQSACVNPGIVSAAYVIGNLTNLSSTRPTNSCQSLGVPYTFNTPGSYVITMTVTDANGKTDTATMSLVVIQPGTQDGGFTITVAPMIAQINTQVTFTGYCSIPGTTTINWVFADGTTATGQTVQHSYSADGLYVVSATCANSANTDVKTASVTMDVEDQGITIPNLPANDTPQIYPWQTTTPVQTTYQGPVQTTYQGPVQTTYQGPVQSGN